MICPHCRTRLLRKERTGHRCSRCSRAFALDPKVERLSDLQIRRLVERLTDGGRLVCTIGQLRYALEPRGPRRRTAPAAPAAPPAPLPPRPRPRLARHVGKLVVGLVFVVVSWFQKDAVRIAIGVALGVGMTVDGYLALRRRRRRLADWRHQVDRQRRADRRPTPPPVRPVRPRWSEETLRRYLTQRWTAVYGGLPEGVVDERAVRAVPGGPPTVALLCPDRDAAACLHANGFPVRHRAVVAADPSELPDGLPVVVLHDASARGLLLAGEVRAAHPGRLVIDAGLVPSGTGLALAGATAERTVNLREPEPAAPDRIARLRDELGLTEGEAGWFASGWWSPLAAVPPKHLLAAAACAVTAATDRRPSALGFLSRPARPRQPRPSQRPKQSQWPEQSPWLKQPHWGKQPQWPQQPAQPEDGTA